MSPRATGRPSCRPSRQTVPAGTRDFAVSVAGPVYLLGSDEAGGRRRHQGPHVDRGRRASTIAARRRKLARTRREAHHGSQALRCQRDADGSGCPARPHRRHRPRARPRPAPSSPLRPSKHHRPSHRPPPSPSRPHPSSRSRSRRPPRCQSARRSPSPPTRSSASSSNRPYRARPRSPRIASTRASPAT